MGKLKTVGITSDPTTKVVDLKDDLAGQLLMQLFYGKALSLPVAPLDVTPETEKQINEIANVEIPVVEDDDQFVYEYETSSEECDFESDYYDEYDEREEEYQFQLASKSSKRLTSSHDTNYYESKLRSKNKWKQEKVNPDRFQNATRAAAKLYRVIVYQNNDLLNRNGNSSNGATYRTINYVGGCSPVSTSTTTTTRNTRSNNQTNYNENDALQRAIKESQQEHLLTTTATTTGLTLNQLRDLQNREFSPEDYEMLLLLDKQIAPKCLTLAQVKALPCKLMNEEDVNNHIESPCMVCLCEFETEERIRTLPCGHIFHDECVTQWLTGSSTVCPTCKSSVC